MDTYEDLVIVAEEAIIPNTRRACVLLDTVWMVSNNEMQLGHGRRKAKKATTSVECRGGQCHAELLFIAHSQILVHKVGQISQSIFPLL